MENPLAERIVIRRFAETDSIPAITRLLHAAYAPLAAMDLRFTATWQDDAITARRLAGGLAWIAELDGEIAGTVTLYPVLTTTSDCPWYRQPGVFSFGQFAVDPPFQGRGIGTRLIHHLEAEALALGASELALDTAEGATDLIRWYEKLGFRFIETMEWGNTNYRSMILSKSLSPGAPSGS